MLCSSFAIRGRRPVKLIVGLGNPGIEYRNTRHNIGFMVIDQLAEKYGVDVQKKMMRSVLGQGWLGSQKVILAKPLTYMNLSGQSVQALMNWYKLTAQELLVICDDLNLEAGHLRLRKKGSDGGHNGLKSIIQALGTSDFPRLRLGIGRPSHPGQEQVSFVLGKFAPQEAELLSQLIGRGEQAAAVWVENGIDAAMNEFNRSRREDKEDK
jgi:PTH1 family peptidyl-tRNA hydrolase